MATIHNVRLAGIASAVPKWRPVEWSDFGVPGDWFPRARDWQRRPSIRAAEWEQCQSDFCLHAAQSLMEKLGWQPSEIEVLVLVTLTPDYPIPATAIILQDRLGLPKGALAFDIPGGEAAFLHGMQLVASMLSAGHLKRGLLLCGAVSKVRDGSYSIEAVDHIRGDNGGVCAFEYSPGAPPMQFASGGDGSAHLAYHMPIGGTRRPPRAEMFPAEATPLEQSRAMQYLLDTRVIEEAAQRELPGCLRAVPGPVDFCFLQPITPLVDDTLRRELGFPRDRFYSLIPEFGVAYSGGIVLAMLARAASTLSTRRCTSLLGGLGAGLTWSSAVVTTENLICPELLEL